ncbi:substrate-binding domain-containing protein [Actinomadura chokoriensis]|uniref:Substrate-binding domain-containing protein n=1 Tax=Actinomadura chokoriensis TaxID=454156 RepID=A0ABV4R7Y1_9ACTN
MDEEARPLWRVTGEGATPHAPRFAPLRRSPAALAAAALLLSGASGGAWASGLFSAPACSGAPVRIMVAAQPEIAPALSDVASRFNVEKHRVGGRCAHARVTPVAPASYKGQADAWVPESSLWLSIVREGGSTSVPLTATSVAATPVVLATTRPVEKELVDADVDIGWKLLLKGKAGGLPLERIAADPSAGMTGTIAMLAIGQVDKDADVAEALRKNGGSTATLAGLMGAERFDRPLAVSTEQAVVAYNETHRPNPVVSLMPDEGTLMLDHPFAVTTKDQRRRDAAEAFQAALGTRSARNIFQGAGFRVPDGTLAAAYASEYDLPEKAPKPLRLPARKEIDEALSSWKT